MIVIKRDCSLQCRGADMSAREEESLEEKGSQHPMREMMVSRAKETPVNGFRR